MKQPCVYMVASKPYGTIYIGVTMNVLRRAVEHRYGLLDGFTKKYGARRLVYYQFYETMLEAIHREKCLKQWKRKWKIELIQQENPLWNDLAADWFD